MARAYGANAQLLGKFETTYGTPPSGNYIKFPFVSSQLGSEQGLIASDLLGHSLLFTAHEVYLPKPKLGLSGPAGVQANFNWQAAKSATAGCMLTVTLKNDVESYA